MLTTSEQLELQVERILRGLRIGGKLKGLKYLVYAISETVRDPNRTELITKILYSEIAAQYDSKPGRVERDIRFAVRTCWVAAREELIRIAGYDLDEPPTNREFIDLVAFYIRSK